MLIALLIVVALVVITLLYGVGLYNRLVALRQKYRNGYAQIDVQLKRRYDLIPNLVNIAKEYLKHEKETLDAVISARGAAVSASKAAAAQPGDSGLMSQLAGAEGLLGGALGRLMAVSEAYPDLKGNETMAQLTEELTSTENKIGFARQAYNDTVMHYNTAIEQFPAALFSGALGFKAASLLEFEGYIEREAPKVDFGS